MSALNPCRRCGHDVGPGCPPRPNSCGHCPPVQCSECREPDDRVCSCWISLDGLGLADIKGLFASAELSIDTPEADR
ncbi:hypothetical protein NSI01_55110 [Pimelobacter simplex]|nr:hypothetical protein NSI01_55110 [Pimelobacter simplex]